MRHSPHARASSPAPGRRKQRFAVIAVVLSLPIAAPAAHAALLTDPVRIQNFDDAATYDLSASRVQIGAALGLDVGVTAAHGTLYFGAPVGAWGLGSNGEWTSAKSFVGIDGAGDPDAGVFPTLTFDFGGKTVRSVGAQLNFVPDLVYGGGLPLPLYIAAYDRTGRLLDSYELPVSTPGRVDAGPFYGIAWNTARIARFEVSGPYAVVDDLTFNAPVPARGPYSVVDGLTVSAPIPEPGTYAMLIAGLAAVGFAARRRAR